MSQETLSSIKRVSSPEQAEALQRWAVEHPDEWIRDVLGRNLYPLQAKIARAVFKTKRVAVRSCYGAGKSFDAGSIVLCFLENIYPSTVITTAPTFRQVERILWREIAKGYSDARYPLSGTLTSVQLKIDENWFALGLSTDQPERFLGMHNKNVLVVGDEASGLPPEIFDAIENPMSTGDAHLLYIGNPTTPTGGFRDCFDSPLYTKFHISAFDTPNFTTFGITLEDIRHDTWVKKIIGRPAEYRERSPELEKEIIACLPMPQLITPQWVAERHEDWGEGSFLWKVNVMGDFPESGVQNLFKMVDVESAIERSIEPDGDMRAAVDVARYGDDKSVIGFQQGNHVFVMNAWSKSDLTNTSGRVLRELRLRSASLAIVDAVGVGGGVYDFIKGEVENTRLVEFNSGAAAKESERFGNRRAELYWMLARKFEEGSIEIPDDNELKSQLCDIRFRFDAKGRMWIETKEEMRSRGSKSPDKADVLMMLQESSSRIKRNSKPKQKTYS